MRFFIAYHPQDRKIALHMQRRLHDSGYRVWCACIGQRQPEDKRAFLLSDYVILPRDSARFSEGAKRRQKTVIVTRSAEQVLAYVSSPRRTMPVFRFVFAIVAVCCVVLLIALLQPPSAPTSSPNISVVAQAGTLSPTSRPLPTSTPTLLTPTLTLTPSPTIDFTATVNALQTILFGTPQADTAIDDGEDIPFASFYAEPAYGEAPLTVTFYNDSFGDVTDTQWDFDGDGVTDSSVADPVPFTYDEPGEYLVTLWVVNEAGEGEPAEMQIIVYERSQDDSTLPTHTPTQRPTPNADEAIASFVANPSSGYAPLTVNFVNDTLGNATSFAWDFNGDGVTDSTAGNPPAYTFTTEGEYTVSLSVVSVAGYSDQISAVVFVYPPEETIEKPVASFTVSMQNNATPLTVAFTNTTVGEATVFLWDFNGDGVTDSREQNPAPYTYAVAGRYSPRLLVSGPGGVSAPFSMEIDVNSVGNQTPTWTASPSPTLTLTPTMIPTYTSTPTATASLTVTSTASPTSTSSPTMTATIAPSSTAMPSATAEQISETLAVIVTSTTQITETATITPSPTMTVTMTASTTATTTATATSTPTSTVTATPQ